MRYLFVGFTRAAVSQGPRSVKVQGDVLVNARKTELEFFAD